MMMKTMAQALARAAELEENGRQANLKEGCIPWVAKKKNISSGEDVLLVDGEDDWSWHQGLVGADNA